MMPNDIIVSVKGHILCTASREMANLIKSKVTNISFTARANHLHYVKWKNNYGGLHSHPMYMNCKKSLSDGQESQRLRSQANGHSNSVMCPRLIIVRGRKCSPWRSPQWPFPSESHPTSTLWPLPFPPRPTTQWASYSNTSHVRLPSLDWLGCGALYRSKVQLF